MLNADVAGLQERRAERRHDEHRGRDSRRQQPQRRSRSDGARAGHSSPASRSKSAAPLSSPKAEILICGGLSSLNGFRTGLAATPGRKRIFEIDVSLSKQRLRRLADEIGEKLLRRLAVRRGLQHRRAGHVDHRADVAAGEVVEGAVHLALADLLLQARPVVVVDDPHGDATAVDGRHHAFVVVKRLGVLLEAFEPGERRCFSLERGDRADERQEVRVARRDADLALVGRPGEIHDRLRQLAGLDHGRVVGEHVFARQHADPVAFGRVVLRGDLGQRFRVDRSEQAFFREELQLRRILGEVNIRRRRRAFLSDLIGDFRSLSNLDLDRNPGAFLEVGNQEIDRLLMLAAVKRQRRSVFRERRRRGAGQGDQKRQQGDEKESAATMVLRRRSKHWTSSAQILVGPRPPAGRGLHLIF